jgi:C-terminal processing protease CtpA/Prc
MEYYGFKELKILEGNIGYMVLSIFFSTKYAGETAITAMNYFSNCHALIIDLRKNRGGWDDMVTLLSSYFFDSEDNVIFAISHSTLDHSYYASMTSVYVPGKRLSDIPLYILTSPSTGSAAEAFTHIHKHLNPRATIVGEKTSGAENPVDHLALNSQFILRIPCWKKIYTFTDSRWEGEGIEPDIKVDADKALSVAHMEALKKLQKETADNAAKMKYQWVFDGLNARNNPVSVDRNRLQSYTGRYRDRIISYENGELYYQWGRRPKSRMIPISDIYFILESYDYFRIRFKKKEGDVVILEEVFTNGRVIENQKRN